jgi:hypothetical protein
VDTLFKLIFAGLALLCALLMLVYATAATIAPFTDEAALTQELAGYTYKFFGLMVISIFMWALAVMTSDE